MKKNIIKFAQEQLNAGGFDAGAEDGIYGDRTLRAVENAFEKRGDQAPDGWRKWSKKRKLIAYIQMLCQEKEIEVGKIDGFWGPQTEFAYDSLSHLGEHGRLPEPWRDIEPADENPNAWPRQSEDQLIRYFGEVGKNQTRIQLPFTHRLSWDKKVRINRFSCHEKVHDSLERVLTRVLDHYGLERIIELRLDLWGGCLNVRRMRGGTKWSMHSWGIALDYDPERNQLKWGRDRAAFARPEYDRWWSFWEEEGWVSLGRSANFDWMHVQAAKR
jgi:hypothetical protein